MKSNEREIMYVGAREGEVNSNLTPKLSSQEINRDLLSELNHQAAGIFDTRIFDTRHKNCLGRECRCALGRLMSLT